MSRQQYERFFDEADQDGSHTLSIEELVTVVKKNQPGASESVIRNQFRSLDLSGDGQISKNEFLAAMGFVPYEKQDMMRQVFNEFDLDGNGTIDKSELDKVFRSMKKCFSDAELQIMMKQMDSSNDGQVDYNEFIKAVFDK